jgi:hypothetical protein
MPDRSPDHSYDVTVVETPDGKVHVTVEMIDTTLDGDCIKSVDLGKHANHQAAARTASTWIATDLCVFSVFR